MSLGSFCPLSLCNRLLLELFVVNKWLLLHSFCIGEDLLDVLVVLLDLIWATSRIVGERVSDRVHCLSDVLRVPISRHDHEVLDPVELAIKARDLDPLEDAVINRFRSQESHQLCLSRVVVTSQDRSQESAVIRQHSRGAHIWNEIVFVFFFEEVRVQLGCTYIHPRLVYRID